MYRILLIALVGLLFLRVEHAQGQTADDLTKLIDRLNIVLTQPLRGG